MCGINSQWYMKTCIQKGTKGRLQTDGETLMTNANYLVYQYKKGKSFHLNIELIQLGPTKIDLNKTHLKAKQINK